MRLAVRDAFDGSCGPGALASGLRGAVGRVSTVPDADVQRLVDEAVCLNELPRTFTRATAAYDPWAKRTVASGEARRRPIMLGRGRCVLADLIEGSRQNLILQSQTFQTTWTANGASVLADVAMAPDGTLTADKIVENTANSVHNVYQFVALADSTVYATSIYVRASGRTRVQFRWYNKANAISRIYVNLTDGAIVNDNVLASGFDRLPGGWCRIWFTFNSGTGATGPYGSIYLENAFAGDNSYQGDGVSGVFPWGAQIEAGAFPSSYIATTTAAVTRNADSLAASLAGLIDTRTNLLVRSQEFQTTWSTTGLSSVGADATAAPDGTTTADALIEDGTTGSHRVYQTFSFVAATVYTASVYVKASNRTTALILMNDGVGSVYVTIDLTNGNLSGQTISGGSWTSASSSSSSLGNGWYRVTITATAGNTGAGNVQIYSGPASYTGTNLLSAIYAWGAQLSTTAAAIEYLPTAATAFTTPPSGVSIDHGTVKAVYIPYGSGGQAFDRRLAFGTLSGVQKFLIDHDTGNMRAVRYDSASYVNASVAAVNPTDTDTRSATWESTGVTEYRNGQRVASAGSPAMPYAQVDTMRIGSDATPAFHVYGWVALLYWPRALTPAEHQEFDQAVRAAA